MTLINLRLISKTMGISKQNVHVQVGLVTPEDENGVELRGFQPAHAKVGVQARSAVIGRTLVVRPRQQN